MSAVPHESGRWLPYSRQAIDEEDIRAVVEVLRGDWLTTGPKVDEFERSFAELAGAREAVAVSSGTAALHAMVHALGIGAGDEVIVPAITFAATANCVVYQGGTPVFADVEADTLLLDAADAARKITPRTRAIIAVDYAGQPADYDALRALATRHGLALLADACHSVGGANRGRPVGGLADMSAFSFHPVKHIATGEGGMVTTDNAAWAAALRRFRNHGITTDHRQREAAGSWFYEMVELGYNYRLTDIQCALGLSQMKKLPGWVARRQEIARRYDEAFAGLDEIAPLTVRPDRAHAYHLYVVQCEERKRIFAALRAAGLGVNVHYIPVHLHPFYRERYRTGPGLCPVAEAAYERIISLPIFPRLSDEDVERVLSTVRQVAVEKA